MKSLILVLLAILISTSFAQTERRAGGLLIVDAHGVAPEPTLFFAADSQATVQLTHEGITQSITLNVRVLQGTPEVITLALSGAGEVTAVSGSQVQFWAVRQGTGEAANQRFLEIRPTLPTKDEPALTAFQATITTAQAIENLPSESTILTLGPGEAVGYAGRVDIVADDSIAATVMDSTGWLTAAEETGALRFQTVGDNVMKLLLEARGAAALPVELTKARLEGTIDDAARSASFTLSGVAIVRGEKGGSLRVLSGYAALREWSRESPYQIRLVTQDDATPYYELHFSGPGEFPVELGIDARLEVAGEWRSFDFAVPASAIVPMRLTNLSEDLRFDSAKAVFPTRLGDDWLGFLPPNGQATTAWRSGKAEEDGKLFYATREQTEVSVSAGLLRQTLLLEVNVLQGKLDTVLLDFFGEGEILAIEGPSVLGWMETAGENGARRLSIPVSQSIAGQSQFIIRSQTPVGTFPVTVIPIRLTPVDSVRHAGSLRIGNQGAVSVQIGSMEGMTQLSPDQFPGDVVLTKDATQVYVYRLPSANYAYEIQADQIMPEVNVSQITLYHMGDADRRLEADIELDIREASLREWEFLIPEDHAVVAVSGADVVDHVLSSAAQNGMRRLKILFGQMVSGRHVVSLQLEKNEAPAAGDWALARLGFPRAKSVRGYLGVTATPGYRISAGVTEKLSELPLTQFPKQKENLQQAYRLREADWAASMTVEALGQSVQADVFHLYSLKEGMVYGSVLLNYYVVGAPVSHWRLQVPEAMGNIGIDGEDVQTWRRTGNEIDVTLHEPALGPSTLLLTFEQPMSVDGGNLTLGEVTPLDVQGERGFIQIVSPYQVRHDVTEVSDNLIALEANELPAEFRLLTSAPSLAAYQYSVRPFTLGLNVQWLEPGKTVDQTIEYASLMSEVSRDGEVATTAVYHVKTRGQQGLRLRLPTGATLWDAQVNGRMTNARADGAFTVIPLIADAEPNKSVAVTIRYGQRAMDAKRPEISAPSSDSAVMIHAWKVRSDHDHLLIPRGHGAAQLAHPALTETGFEWLIGDQGHWGEALIVALLVMLGGALRMGDTRDRTRQILATFIILTAMVWCGVLTHASLQDRRVNQQTIELVAPVITPGAPMTVAFAHVGTLRAMLNPLGVACVLMGAVLLLWAKRPGLVLGGTLLGTGLLLQHLGAPLFFGVLGICLGIYGFVGCWRSWRGQRTTSIRAGTGSLSPTPPAISSPLWIALALSASAMFGAAPVVKAAEVSANTLTQQWRIDGGRLFGESDFTVSGRAGDRFVLLKSPAVLTAFTPDSSNARVARRAVEGGVDYDLVIEADGTFEGNATFEMALTQPLSAINFPTGMAAVHRMTVTLDQADWEISSPAAVRSQNADAGENASSVEFLLGIQGEQCLALTPRSRDLGAEDSQFYAEVNQVYIPRPGVIDARHLIFVRPSQGQVREFTMTVPTGFTVSDVRVDRLRTWRFDPETRRLRIELETAQAEGFQLVVFTQQALGNLPSEVTLEPLRVESAAGEVGMLGIAFGPDSQPDSITAEGLSAVNLEDFNSKLLGEPEGNPLVLHRVYRYGAEPGKLTVRVTGVDPEIRTDSRQTLSLGEERVVLAIDLTASVTRAGLFQLRFAVPDGFDVEAISGSHLDHWSETTEAGVRYMVLHLKGRSMGELTFAISLVGASPGPVDSWTVPNVLLDGAYRATGQLVITPDLGIRAQAVSRRNVSQLDTRKLARKQAGTLAFQLLQADWELALRIEQLQPWITAQTLQEVTLREGQTRTRLAIAYQIENAAVKALRLRLPGLTAADEQSVHASGEAIGDLVRIPDEEDLWEIRFQRGMLGPVLVTIDYQQSADRSLNVEAIDPAILSEIQQATHWVAVRSAGRLDLGIDDEARRWQTVDWSTVPHEVRGTREEGTPRLCVRAVAPDGPLQVRVVRHSLAEALKLRVVKGFFRSLLSAGGAQVTKVNLSMEVAEKSPLRVTLPAAAVLMNVFVNGQSVDLVKEGDDETYSFYVYPQEDTAQAHVGFAYGVYGKQSGTTLSLTAPLLELPLRDITWEVVLPNGYTLIDQEGMLELQSQGEKVRFDLASYQASQAQRQAQQAESAIALLDKANDWLRKGQQDKARESLEWVTQSASLDASSNEDARVQLRQLQTEQALLGLNTRRQSFYLENLIETPDFARNEQMEQAANANPFLKGKLNYDPQKVDDLLHGNTAEENSALKRMANRLVSHQQAADPGLRGMEITLPARGERLTFHRSVQVDSATPLSLGLKIAPQNQVPWWFIGLVVLLLALAAAVIAGRRNAPRPEYRVK